MQPATWRHQRGLKNASSPIGAATKNDKKYNVTKYTKIMIYVLICKGAFLKVEKWKEQLGNAALLKL